VKYLVDELTNSIQLHNPENAASNHIDAELVAQIHSEPFKKHMEAFREQMLSTD